MFIPPVALKQLTDIKHNIPWFPWKNPCKIKATCPIRFVQHVI